MGGCGFVRYFFNKQKLVEYQQTFGIKFFLEFKKKLSTNYMIDLTISFGENT